MSSSEVQTYMLRCSVTSFTVRLICEEVSFNFHDVAHNVLCCVSDFEDEINSHRRPFWRTEIGKLVMVQRRVARCARVVMLDEQLLATDDARSGVGLSFKGR